MPPNRSFACVPAVKHQILHHEENRKAFLFSPELSGVSTTKGKLPISGKTLTVIKFYPRHAKKTFFIFSSIVRNFFWIRVYIDVDPAEVDFERMRIISSRVDFVDVNELRLRQTAAEILRSLRLSAISSVLDGPPRNDSSRNFPQFFRILTAGMLFAWYHKAIAQFARNQDRR